MRPRQEVSENHEACTDPVITLSPTALMRPTKGKSHVRREDHRVECQSPKSFEDAIQNGIAQASKTIHGIKSAWVKEQHAVIDNGKVALYRVDLKVTFVLD